MSLVVAIKDNGKVVIGANSQSTRGSSRTSLSNQNNYKIWKVKGVKNCLMGHAGALRDACAIRVMTGLIDELTKMKDDVDYEYVVNEITPKIIEELKERLYVKVDGYFDMLESRFILAYKDRLFLISNDGTVLEIDDYCVIGSGESEAIGSLLSTGNEKDVSERIIKAIKASATHDIYVDYPIVLSNTETTEFKKITE